MQTESTAQRRPLIIANWKMHKHQAEARDFIREFLGLIEQESGVEAVICPPFTALNAVADSLEDSTVGLGAQNMFWEDRGAYTGEVSPLMLKDCGCRYVLVGHSERRAVLGEDNSIVNRKLNAALRHGLVPVMCIGETLEQRQAGQAFQIIQKQMSEALHDIDFAQPLVIAYEPVWAIGTGVNAAPEDAQNTAAYIRSFLKDIGGEYVAASTRILYGGSVKSATILDFMQQPDIDGALVGGASLEAAEFARIVRYDSVD